METRGEQQESEKQTRPPIVVVMGHVDHGKTTILDWYRKTKVAEWESGGITQHIGAYEVEHHGKKITFIDTPGHEAFTKMRSRGARIADIAVLVIAADEGVKPQTKESLGIIQASNTPFLVALNKIDKGSANPERVKQELAKENVLVESYGGKVPSVEISAKEGKNMDELLETILLMAELEGLIYNPRKPAEGTVIEAHQDPKRGITATLLIRDGVLRCGDFLVIDAEIEKIKILENFRGEPIDAAHASSPASVTGLGTLPPVGEWFSSYALKEEARSHVATQAEEKTDIQPRAPAEGEKTRFNIIIKTDVAGSQEAISDAVKKLENDEIGITIIHAGTGDIIESDIKRAQATKTVTIVGFRVKIHSFVQELARISGVRIITGEIIYELIDEVKKRMADMLPPEVRRKNLGGVKILKLFKKNGLKQIIGGSVFEGIIRKGSLIEVKRGETILGRGTITQLQHNKIDTSEVAQGKEFGVMIESSASIREGDVLEVFEEETVKRTL